MIRYASLLRCLLLMLLAAGPLQAQTVLLCDMMDVPRQEQCCCDEPATSRAADRIDPSCDRPPCSAAPRVDADGCCDSAVEVSHQGGAGAAVAKVSFDRSDLDPPAPTLVVFDLLAPPAPPQPPPLARPLTIVLPSGSDLYLRTERFRI